MALGAAGTAERVALGLLLAASAGCGRPGAESSQGPSWHYEEVGRFGAVDSPGASLTQPMDIALVGEELLVLEWSPQRIAVFGLDGAWRRDIGRAGAGPGEFRGPRRLGVTGDRLWVGDVDAGALEIFTLDGEHERSIRWDIQPDSGGERAFALALLDGDRVLAGPRALSIGSVLGGRTDHHSYYRASMEGNSADPIYTVPLSRSDAFSVPLPDGRAMVGRHPLSWASFVEPFPDGSGFVAIQQSRPSGSEDAAFRIVRVDANGIVSTDRAVAYVPRETTGWLDAHIEQLASQSARIGQRMDPAHERALREGLSVPDFYPPVTGLRTGLDGTIWVRREEVGDSVVWDVFEGDGRPVATVPLPGSMSVLRPSLDEVWAVSLDELDVPFVVRLRRTP